MSSYGKYMEELNELIELKFGNVEIKDFFFNKNKKGEIKASATIIKDEKPHEVEFKVFEDGTFNIISGEDDMIANFTKILTEILIPHITKYTNEITDLFGKFWANIFGKKEEEVEKLNDFALIYDSKNGRLLFTDMNGSAYEFPRKESKVSKDIENVIESWKKDSIKDYEIDAEKLGLDITTF
jgi:hypothetical protein